MVSTNSIKTCGCQYQSKQLMQDVIFNSNITEGLTPHVATMYLIYEHGREQKNYTTRLP